MKILHHNYTQYVFTRHTSIGHSPTIYIIMNSWYNFTTFGYSNCPGQVGVYVNPQSPGLCRTVLLQFMNFSYTACVWKMDTLQEKETLCLGLLQWLHTYVINDLSSFCYNHCKVVYIWFITLLLAFEPPTHLDVNKSSQEYLMILYYILLIIYVHR